ncbi:Small glutamine-rich tetratricopeptide repeat-containing protein [Hondaea fermentalgiana]|uniref:Small glutamine-rich tetratricopeptide repeat-containing protein n=1 Tax=Hondaea fermentalgiana TaxID=2315210 RepID=A0A2R5GMZ8_9STRA|nr:Small glutamine-rich tetratricopeptide repeat-containing protein [Hondaea fermentalgiana]|eukprot:GBG29681.1 Small glutamine-rich tetratricopeptide repeat-containing protein [Hondaea fermentalgiana]
MGESGPNNGAAAFYASNQHNDVLNAAPDSDEARQRLVDELKRRGNAAFSAKSLPEADVLYSKAIEHDSKIPALFGNRAMARLMMGRFKDALEDAEAAIELDASWTKAWFRAGKAEVGLEKLDEAQKRFEKILELEPDNKAAQQEIKAMPERRQKLEQKKKREAAEAEQKAKERAELAKDKVVSKRIVEVSKDQASGAAAAKKKSSSSEKDGEIDLSLRGYRTLPDGRKTTFFNRELTEEEKEMLKDNKPKQVSEEAEAILAKEQELASKGASAWNHGGTFEERPMSKWAEPKLKEYLESLSCPVQLVDSDGDAESGTLKVTDLKNIDGDASITFTRGKKRHMFDYSLDVAWSVACLGKTVSGTIFLPDVSADEVSGDPSDGVVEAELRWSNREKAGANQAVISKTLMDTKSGLLAKVNEALNKWAVEFRKIQ